jgi:hypothetical protein
LQEVGEAAYIEAIRRVMQGTLDRNDVELCRQLGSEQAAHYFFDNWKLGYTSTRALTGLVAPLKMWGDIGTLGYVSKSVFPLSVLPLVE